MRERWKTCEEFTNYQVSNTGRVRRWLPPVDKVYYRKSGKYKGNITQRYTRVGVFRELKVSTTSCGYATVCLYDFHGSNKNVLVHRLVCRTFYGEPPTEKHVTVDHLDGDRVNNIYTNLRWATHSEQRDTSRRLGTLNAGDKHYNTKIPSGDIESIRQEYIPRHPIHGAAAIAERYCVSRQCIGMIIRRVNRQHE